jgi:hypothetical protein
MALGSKLLVTFLQASTMHALVYLQVRAGLLAGRLARLDLLLTTKHLGLLSGIALSWTYLSDQEITIEENISSVGLPLKFLSLRATS